MFGRRNPGWVAGLAAVVLVAACSDSGDSASTARRHAPEHPAGGRRSVRPDTRARAGGGRAQEELATARDDLADARADIDSLVGRVAGLTGRLADMQLTLDSEWDYMYSWVQPYFDQYRLEMELLRPLIPLPDTPGGPPEPGNA